MGQSLLERLAKRVTPEELLRLTTPEQRVRLLYEWRAMGRPEQLEPPGLWRVWMYLGGRGVGKTRTGIEWVRGFAETHPGARIAIIARTATDVRNTVLEGDSGLMNVSPPWFMPVHEPSRMLVRWPNGTIAQTFSAEEPRGLRGPAFDAALCDELAAWPMLKDEDGEQGIPGAWTQLQYGMRRISGSRPRILVTTTPRPVRIIRELVAASDTYVTKGATKDNEANLSPDFIRSIYERYAGSRLGRQELNGELLEDVEGAIFSHDIIDQHRVTEAPTLRRIVVAVDPSGSAKKTADEAGIVVAGVDDRGHVYVLEDLTGRYSPRDMGIKAVAAYHRWNADRLVAEDNFGGKIIEDIIALIDPRVAYKAVHASRGKIIRAEPVAAQYETGKVHHVGTRLDELEDEMCLPAGTSVLTAYGEVPIECITDADVVVTRAGYRRVRWAGMTGMSSLVELATASGKHLRCTPKHPVYIDGVGFIRASEVNTGDRLLLCTPSRDHLSHLVADVTFSLTTVTSRQVAPLAADCSIATYGRQQTAQSRWDGMFTTETRIDTTTRWITSSRSQCRTTSASTASQAHGQSHPMLRAPSAKQSGPRDGLALSCVMHAGAPLLPGRTRQSIVHENAGQVVPVYNLAVETDEEYFANSILVHNCSYTPLSPESPGRLDACVWAVHDLILRDQPVTLGEGPIVAGERRMSEVALPGDDDEEDERGRW